MSDDYDEDGEDAFETFSVDISPKLAHTFVKERRATTGCLDEGSRYPGQSDNDLSVPPSPMYYKKHVPCSSRGSPKSLHYDSMGSFASLQKYCSSLSIGSYLGQQIGGQENVVEFVIPSRATPPRSSTLTATRELLYHIKKKGSKHYNALIRDKMDSDEVQPRLSDVSSTTMDDESEGFKILEDLMDFDDQFVG